ncbi:hypothetical protein HFX_0354 [Haloferax mediterranei ATCC 33500]|uniref:Uncharacterized protein n=1 Tax=Haloferax mediterranei (strain ATCC 33500 / DSM 1411 / JCM 8866 / NBRC 14739 / NCIMB 2177 / R-4) TaxID=523841 RepID=I3R1I0_HALMT|nr:hypothetical protein HFX_0354 [Haloferax mediterranei ATCC 33500]
MEAATTCGNCGVLTTFVPPFAAAGRFVPLFDGVEVPNQELFVGDAVFFDVDEESFEFLAWLMTEFPITGLTEVFESFAVSFPAVPLFVVFARRRPDN